MRTLLEPKRKDLVGRAIAMAVTVTVTVADGGAGMQAPVGLRSARPWGGGHCWGDPGAPTEFAATR